MKTITEKEHAAAEAMRALAAFNLSEIERLGQERRRNLDKTHELLCPYERGDCFWLKGQLYVFESVHASGITGDFALYKARRVLKGDRISDNTVVVDWYRLDGVRHAPEVIADFEHMQVRRAGTLRA